MPEIVRRTLPLALLVAGAAAVGCESVGRYLSERPEDRLVEAAVGHWAARGEPFLDGVSGEDTVASVTATGARGWQVAVLPPSGGVPSIWALEIVRVEIVPLFPGDAFAPWLEERAQALGLPTYLPPEVALGIRAGDIRAVGDLEVRYGPAGRSTRRTVERIAYLTPKPYSDATEWHVQPDSGGAALLIEALKLVSDDLLHGDPEVRSCMGGGPPADAERSTQLACLAEVLGGRFGEG
jgi:hypothetical protein